MDNETVVEQIVKSLSFEVVAVPQDVVQLTSTSKSTPLNVKIRLRKENEAGLKYGVLSEPKDGRDNIPERIRFASSDHTIVSFNVTMEAGFEKVPKKPGICMGMPNTENHYPYLPVKTGVIEGTGHSERGLKNKFTLSKTDDNLTAKAIVVSKKNKDIFGKCKPGGCLDPPFSEEKYSYKPAKENLSPPAQDEVNKIKTSSIFKNKLFKRNKKSDHVSDIHVSKDAVDIDSTSSLYQAGSLQTSKTYSNSIITYPPTLTLSETRIQEEKHASIRFSKEDKSKLSFSEGSGSYFMMTKKTKNLLDQNIVFRNSDFHEANTELKFVAVDQEKYTTKKPQIKNDELPQINISQTIPSESKTVDEDAICIDVTKTAKEKNDISVINETYSKLLVPITNELKFVTVNEGKHTTKEHQIKDDELIQVNTLRTKSSVPEVANADALSIDVSRTDRAKLKEYEDIRVIDETDSKLLVSKTNELNCMAIDQGKYTTTDQEIKDDEVTQVNILRTKPSVPEIADADALSIDVKLKENEDVPVIDETHSKLFVPITNELKSVAVDQGKYTTKEQKNKDEEVIQVNIVRTKPLIPELADVDALCIDETKTDEVKFKKNGDILPIIKTKKSDNSLTGPIADKKSVESDHTENKKLRSNLAKENLNIKPLNDTDNFDVKNKITQNLNGSYDLIHQTSIAHELISSPEYFKASINNHSVINRDFRTTENTKIVGQNNVDLIQQPNVIIVKEKSTLQEKLTLDSQISPNKTSKDILISESKSKYDSDPKFLQNIKHDSIGLMEKIKTDDRENIRSDKERIINVNTSKVANFDRFNNQSKNHKEDGLATENVENSYNDATREKSFIDLITKYTQPKLEPVDSYAKEKTPENNEAIVVSHEKNKQYDDRSKDNISWVEHNKTDDLKHIWQNKKAPSISEANFHMDTSILTKKPKNTDNLESVRETELKSSETIMKNGGLGLSDKVPRLDTEYSDNLLPDTGIKPFAETPRITTDKIDKALLSDKIDMSEKIPNQESIVSSEPKPVTRNNNDFNQKDFSIIPDNKRQSVDVFNNGCKESSVKEESNRSLEKQHFIELKIKISPDANANNESYEKFPGQMAEVTQIKQLTNDENILRPDKINSWIISDTKKGKKSNLESLKPTKTKLQLVSSKDYYNNDVNSGKMKASNLNHPIGLTGEGILTQRSKENIDLKLFNIDSTHDNKNDEESYLYRDALVSSENLSQNEILFDEITAKSSSDIRTVKIHPEATVNELRLTSQGSDDIKEVFDSVLEQDKLQSDILKKMSYEKLLPSIILKQDFVPIKMDVAFKTYLDENNAQVIKSFDCDNIPDRTPNDMVIIAKCYLGSDSNEIKIPVNSKNNLCIQIKRSQGRSLTELKENVLKVNKEQRIANTLKGSRDPNAKNMDYENVNESEVYKGSKMINDEIRDALIAIYEQELVPLQDIIKGLRNDIENLAACQLMFKKNLSLTSKRSRTLKLREVTKKCGCFKRL